MLGIRDMLLIDDDKVEPHNKPSQMYRMKDIWRPKSESLCEIVKEFTDCNVNYVIDKIPVKGHEREKLPFDVIVSAVDSMSARMLVWDSIVKRNVGCKLFIDGRIGGQDLSIITVTNTCDQSQIESYEKTISSDEKAAQLTCTAQSVIDIGFLISSQISRLVRLHFTGKSIPREIMFNVEDFFSVEEINRNI